MANETRLDFKLSGVILADSMNNETDGVVHSRAITRDEKLIQRQVNIMRQICTEVILVTSHPRHYLPIVDRSVRIITNLYPRRGWLGALYSAFSLCNNLDLWVVGSHMPFISPKAAAMMMRLKRTKGCDAVIPQMEGKSHPLHGIYDKNCLEAVSILLGRTTSSLQDLLDIISVQFMNQASFEGNGVDMRFTQIMNPDPAIV